MKTAYEFKVIRVRECPAAEMIDTPERAADYWRSNIPQADWFDPAKEAFVVLILNTRRRIIGHNLVTLGFLDTCFVHPREVFRPAIVAAGAAVILMHNHLTLPVFHLPGAKCVKGSTRPHQPTPEPDEPVCLSGSLQFHSGHKSKPSSFSKAE